MKSILVSIKNRIKEGILQEMWKEAKWIIRYARKYWKAILYYIVMGVFGTGMGLVGSVASKYLIDAVTGHKSSNIVWIIITIISMAIGNIVIKAVTSRISIRISLKVTNEIQVDIYSKIMNTDWESISGYHSGDILNRFNGDVNTVAGSILGWAPSLITNLIQFIGTLAIILYYDPTLAILALLSAPVTLIMSRLLLGRMRDYNKRMKQIGSEVMSFHEESFQRIRIIKSFDLIHFFSHKLKAIQKNYMDYALDYNKFSIYTTSFMSVIGLVVSYLTLGWSVYRLWSGAITYGTMILFLQFSGNLSGGFSALVGMVPSAIGATTSAGRLMAMIELPREIQGDDEQVKNIENRVNHKGLRLNITHMDFHYRERDYVLKDVCMSACPNEMVAIIGPSGEGKSTLIGIMLGLLNPSKGEVKIIDAYGMEIEISSSTRKFFSYVPQGNTIFSGTIADNLRLANKDATDEELIEVLKTACAYDFIKDLEGGIYAKIGEGGCGFSEGQAQRISIARALLRDAPIILLDEATSALDIDTERKVLQGIMKYGVNQTCILTTHRNSVLSMCDKVYKIDHTNVYELNDKNPTALVVDF